MSTSFRRHAIPTAPEALPQPVVGHLYWDVRGGRVYALNDAARQFRDDGVPLLANQPGLEQMQTPAGASVRGDELPLPTALRDGRPVEMRLVFSPPDKAPRQLMFTASTLRAPSGEVVAVLATISELQALPDWTALAGLAHDLRTPLQAIRFLLIALEQRSLAERGGAEVLDRLRTAAERALEIGSDLLDWCRAPTTGGRCVKREWVPVPPVLLTLLQEQLPAAARKNLSLRADLDEAQGWEVYTDRVRLGRVIMNLSCQRAALHALGRPGDAHGHLAGAGRRALPVRGRARHGRGHLRGGAGIDLPALRARSQQPGRLQR